MWEALEHLSWVEAIGNSSWGYSTVSVTHYVTMFWFIGSIAVVDLRIMGLAAPSRNVEELAREIFPWAWLGCALSIVSGFLMFATDAGDWAPSPHFHIKLALLGMSLIFAAIVHKFAARWSQAPEIPMSAKLIAFVSLALWIATIVSASEIPSKEGLG